MDSKKLIVGSRVTISAIVTKICKDKNRNDVAVIEDVHVNTEYHSDHEWINLSKRLKYPGGDENNPLKVGDRIKATAEVYEYLNSSDLSKKKIGFKSFRSVRIVA